MRLLHVHVATWALYVSMAAGASASLEPQAATKRVLSTTCRFEAPLIVAGSNGYCRIDIPDCRPQQYVGKPRMPYRTVRLVLPPSSRVGEVSTHATGNSRILIAQQPVDFGRRPVRMDRAPVSGPSLGGLPDPAVYESEESYPSQRVETVSLQRMAGYDILILRVFPVQYIPAAGRLVFAQELAVEVSVIAELVPSAGAVCVRSPHAEREVGRVELFVDNPDMLLEYDATAPKPLSTSASGATGASLDGPALYDYLLITGSSLLPSFQPLIDFHAAQGLAVRTETMANVTNSYAGRDSAEKLRNYIRYAYTNWGVKYVLLGGDVAVVPMRGVYAYCSGETETAMPADLYFACLDGSWNGDDDARWGEPTDGDGGGDVDMLAEVFVGRAPVETSAEVERFVSKTLDGGADPDSRLSALFAGEYLGYMDAHAQGGDALDRLSPAFVNSHTLVSWLDDRPSLGAVWNVTDAMLALNASPLLVAHYGHADESTAMRLDISDVGSLTNATPFLFYSAGCDAGRFDNPFGPECIGEELVIRNDAGAFAALVNSRLGWFDGQSEWLYSGEYQQHFFDGLLTGGRPSLGDAHQMAKQDMLGSVETSGDMPYRWCYFGITLLGDPGIAVKVPLSVSFRVTPGEGGFVLEWNSRTNTLYSVFRAPDLTGRSPVCIESNIVATPPVNVHTDATDTVKSGFYWVSEE